MLVQTNLSSFNLVGVEQTTYGYNKLKDRHLPFPVINVGRSELKLKYEAPLVASCVVSKLAEKLHRLSKLPKSVAVIGAGPIGNAVYSFLKKTNRFSITHVKGSQEFNGFLERSGEFDMIIGCTGKTLFEPDDFTRLKSGVVLVCASYSDKEFNAAYLRRKAPKIISCHDDIDINGICLLNCGFPINFDDHYETVDPEYFQITRSLLTTAIFQAINLGKGVNQLVDLDIAVQKRIESSILSDPSYQAILSSDPG
ncbi:MAG: hypothetical protein JSS60_09700 [Verrucomicrobia bacterium]|nr:hypothetical protein [Verrucomicrobiota bacterium]